MRKLFFIATIALGFMAINTANAQVSGSLNINVQPGWGPVGYDHVDYYYLPDIDAYYDVANHQYVYYDNTNSNWVHVAQLPPQDASYDPYHSYKVVINQPEPWMHDNDYKIKYKNYKGRHDQKFIRDSRETKYKEHWKDDDDRH